MVNSVAIIKKFGLVLHKVPLILLHIAFNDVNTIGMSFLFCFYFFVRT